MKNGNGKGPTSWDRREKVLISVGIFVILFTVVAMPPLGYEFHFEYLVGGLALCGVGIAALGDKR